MAETYRTYFKKARVSFSSKERFEISNFSNSRRNSSNRIVPCRILNTFVSAINDVGVLPRFVVFVLNDEIINFTDYSGYGVSTMYGNLLEWLVKKVLSKVEDAKKQLPSKAVKNDYPQIYWTQALNHKQFGKQNELRNKYNLCLESIIKLYLNMRVLKYKNYWDFNDNNLMLNNAYTATGKGVIWQSLDDALKYNIEKKEEYLARALLAQKKGKMT